MWPRWSKFGGDAGGGGACGGPHLNPSFSFRDLRSLVEDEKEEAGSATAPSPAAEAARTSPVMMRRAAVFHRVRVASAALRAWRSLPSAAAAASPEEKKIVLYYTSLRVVRRTFDECRAVRSILRGFRVEIDERDLSMDSGFLSELKQILGKKQLSLPRVFIGSRYVGGFDEIQQLHETGELKKHVEGVPAAAAGVCDACGGMRFVLCGTCSGSHKYFSEKSGFRTCNACNENGLVRCPDCCCGA